MLTTRSLLLSDKETMHVDDFSFDEKMTAHSVKVRIQRGSICRSDVDYFRYDAAGRSMPQPFVLIHEAAGIVEEVGSAVKSVVPGDTVFLNPAVTNPEHPFCKRGLENIDPTVRFLATPPVQGAARDRIIYPERCVVKINDGQGIIDKVPLIEPTACGVHAVGLAGEPKDIFAVVGNGPIGVLAVFAAIHAGWNRGVLVGRSRVKIELCRKILDAAGIEEDRVRCIDSTAEDLPEVVKEFTQGQGVNAVLEAAGSEPALRHAVDILGPRGKLVVVGRTDHATFDMPPLRRKEASILTSYRFTSDDVAEAARLITGNGLDVDSMITHRFPLEQGAEAFRLAAEGHPNVMKIVLTMD